MNRNAHSLYRSVSRVGALLAISLTFVSLSALGQKSGDDGKLDQKLLKILHQSGFTGRVESSLEARLHRKVNPQLADLGRLLFFDVAGGLHDDNTCAGCHSPSSAFGDTQSIAIGVQSNLDRWSEPHRAPQPAAHSFHGQYRFLPKTHVERPVPFPLWRPVR